MFKQSVMLLIAGVLGFVPALARAEKPAEPRLPEFSFPAPLGSVLAVARRAQIPIDRFDEAKERTHLQPGDGVTALVTLTDDDEFKQWLVRFEVAELTEKEMGMPPYKPVKLYATTGNVFEFTGTRAALSVAVLGPFDRADERRERSPVGVTEKHARILIDSEFLALGFHRMAAAQLRLRKNLSAAHFGFNYQPYTPEQIAEGKKDIDPEKFSLEDQRAFAASLPALMEFFRTVIHTPGLDDIAKRVIDIPWWSVIRHGGKNWDLNFDYKLASQLDSVLWGFPATTEAYSFPFVVYLFGKPAVACRLAVFEPRPPLCTTAGIVGLAAQKPDGHGAQLMIRLLASRSTSAVEAPVISAVH